MGPKDGAREREADRLAARALGRSPPGWRVPAPMARVPDPGGQPLDGHTREFFESRFGHDFGRVRVHAGEPAAATARELDAEAYTVGRDVFFRDARDASLHTGDPELLAHELAHVVQAGESRRLGAAIHGGTTLASTAPAPGALVQRKLVKGGHVGPGPGDYAHTFHEYLLYLHSIKGVQGLPLAFNPYLEPTIEEVLSAIALSARFRDEVVEAYDRIYLKDLVEDIIRYSTEEERARLMQPFIAGPGDFPERSKDKAVA